MYKGLGERWLLKSMPVPSRQLIKWSGSVNRLTVGHGQAAELMNISIFMW